MHPAIACDVKYAVVVAEEPGGVAPRSKRVALTIEAGLGAERGIFVERLAAVIGVE